MTALPAEFGDAWLSGDLQRIADAIDTGSGDPNTSRALVLFNTSVAPLAGTVVYRVDMPWRTGRDLPTLRITHLLTGVEVAHSVENVAFDPPDSSQVYGRLRFDLLFAALTVAPEGWDTYIAEYLPAAPERRPARLGRPIDGSDYRVVETMRHGGSG